MRKLHARCWEPLPALYVGHNERNVTSKTVVTYRDVKDCSDIFVCRYVLPLPCFWRAFMVTVSYRASLCQGQGCRKGPTFLLHPLWWGYRSQQPGKSQTFQKEARPREAIALPLADATSPRAQVTLLNKTQPDEFYNLAAQSHVHTSFELPVYTAHVDGIGTLNCLEAIRQAGLAGKTKFYQVIASCRQILCLDNHWHTDFFFATTTVTALAVGTQGPAPNTFLRLAVSTPLSPCVARNER